jgi:hypothetical protein
MQFYGTKPDPVELQNFSGANIFVAAPDKNLKFCM